MLCALSLQNVFSESKCNSTLGYFAVFMCIYLCNDHNSRLNIGQKLLNQKCSEGHAQVCDVPYDSAAVLT